MNSEENTEVYMDKKNKSTKYIPIAAYFPVKVISTFLSLIFALMTVICLYATWELGNQGYYALNGYTNVLDSKQSYIAMRNSIQVVSYVYSNMPEDATRFLADRNVAYLKLTSGDGKVLYEYYRNKDLIDNLPVKYYEGYEYDFWWEVRLLEDLPVHTDAYYNNFRVVSILYNLRFYFVGGIFVGALLFMFAFIFFVSGIGRNPREEGVTENYLTKMPFDIFTALLLFPFLFLITLAWNVSNSYIQAAIIGSALFFPVFWITNLIHRIKTGVVFENSITLRILKFFGKIVLGIPLIWRTVIGLAVYLIIELLVACVVALIISDGAVLIIFALLLIKDLITVPIVLYIAFMIRTLQKGTEKVAAGDKEEKIKTSILVGGFKKQGEALNRISESINIAVEEKMKSERMKTELITNVSHDIKTPLTSVINYSDLINSEANGIAEDKVKDKEQSLHNIVEYSEILNRQSNKLKRLLEDLLDISKAVSKTMEVNLEKIEIGMLLSQAAGEYEERFVKNDLETVLEIEEENLTVMADTRKIWRVFDNLLQNISKYSLPNSRVYLSAFRSDDKVNITFKNMSREQIKLSPEELTERFTRNDESRHMEGNGLGLAIAKTMTELQGGCFKVEIDGDLFKVLISFDAVQESGSTE